MTYNRRQRGTAQPPLGAGLWPLSEALPQCPAVWAGIFTKMGSKENEFISKKITLGQPVKNNRKISNH